MCLDDGSRSTRSTVVEASYVQKTDSESLLTLLSNFIHCVIIPDLNISCLYCVLVKSIQEGRSSQNHSATPLPLPPPLTQAKKWAGGLCTKIKQK